MRNILVTGASTGIGYELAKCCAKNGFDLVVAADEPAIQTAAATVTPSGVLAEMHRGMAHPGTAKK